jgi:2-polyprenyl-3-methyl-5-hydroxy-6-metoxy-1,4-benzoquinol methylase
MTLEQVILDNNLNDFWIEGGTDKNSEHSYCPYYNGLLEQYQDKECEILEIGCWQGGFVFAMSQVLPNAKFTTIDIQDKFLQKHIDVIGKDRVTNHQLVNAYCFETLELIKGKQFDLILDDGTHLLHDELFLFHNYMNYLKPDGKMVIEDINGETMAQLVPHINIKEFNYTIVDLRNIKGRGDDMLIQITRR